MSWATAWGSSPSRCSSTRRPGRRPATAALFTAAKFIPAFVAPGLTARLDQLDLRRTLGAIYLAEALVFGLLAFVADGRYVLALVLVLALVDGTLAVTARALTRGAVGTLLQPVGLLKEANGLMNVGLRCVVRRRRGARRPADRAVEPLARAARPTPCRS